VIVVSRSLCCVCSTPHALVQDMTWESLSKDTGLAFCVLLREQCIPSRQECGCGRDQAMEAGVVEL